METKNGSDRTSQGDATSLLHSDRTAAEHALGTAQDNPVLSGEQACAVAQVHALLAIEQRLGQLAASIDAALTALAHRGNVGGGVVPTPA
jgi:hypothetical protein